MYAFPGGICDETDHGIPGYDPFKITALRETFEEVGILVGNSKHPMTDFS
jgi:8-oxo-dGTP pyrophosphatase MutT (NUDIX family)